LAAKVERVRIWCDENDILDRRARHSVRAHPVVDSADRWAARLDVMIRQLDAEKSEREAISPHKRLRLHLETHYGSMESDG
jgi:hypothetical protein